ncbi:MAG: allantoinase, partial [Pseudomonas sp.]|nr:allantoinase [Pseudomonas sp.]
CRLIGRPARLAALKRFIEYAKGHDQVWFTRRVDIARHWHDVHPFQGAAK